MPINPEALSTVFSSQRQPVIAEPLVELDLGGFKHQLDYRVIETFFELLLTEVAWKPRINGDWSIDYYQHPDALGKVVMPVFYQRDLRDDILPQFMQSEAARACLGVGEIEFREVANEWSYQEHIRKHGRNSGYGYGFDAHSLFDSWYEAEVQILVLGRQLRFSFHQFAGDARDNQLGKSDDGYLDKMHVADLYEAIFIFAALPAEVWQHFFDSGNNFFLLGKYRVSIRDDEVRVAPYNSQYHGKRERPILLSYKRIGMEAVRERQAAR